MTVADIGADVRTWLRNAPFAPELLGEMAKVVSLPSTLEQNTVLDLVDAAVGTHEAVTVDRWVPDWGSVAELVAPVDEQRLWIPLEPRTSRYRETLPSLEVGVHVLDRGPGRTLMLNGHVDVVPADNQEWSTPAFEPVVRDGRMIARGSMDMKAGLVAEVLAFRYLAENWRGPGRVLLAAVPEEESGGDGTLAVLERGYLPDGAVFSEPTGLQVVHRHVGIQGFAVDVAGRPGGMLQRSWGTSAAPVLARVAVALAELEESRTREGHRAGGYDEDDLPGFVNFVMRSGEWIATRAATGHLEGLMGILPGETQAEAAAALTETVERATSSDELPVEVTVWPGGHRGGELDRTHPLVDAFVVPDAPVGAAGAATRAGTMVCDAKIVQGGGWAPAIGFGPVGGGLHAADEWVDLESVQTLVELLVQGAYRYLGAS